MVQCSMLSGLGSAVEPEPGLRVIALNSLYYSVKYKDRVCNHTTRAGGEQIDCV